MNLQDVKLNIAAPSFSFALSNLRASIPAMKSAIKKTSKHEKSKFAEYVNSKQRLSGFVNEVYIARGWITKTGELTVKGKRVLQDD